MRYLLIIFSAFSLFANDSPPVRCIKGISVSDQKPPLRSPIKGVSLHLRLKNTSELENILESYLGSPLDDSSIEEIKSAISDYLEKRRHLIAIVLIPEQEITHGNLSFHVLYGKVGEMAFRGQKWFSSSVLEKEVTIRKGDDLNQATLLNDLFWLNKNPFHYTEAILSPGNETGVSNIEWVTQDRLPLRLLVGADNGGVQVTGEARVWGGATWGNAFQIGDLFSYQYLATIDFHRLQAHTLSYTSFLPRHRLLTVNGSYAQIYPAVSPFHSEGKTAYGSIRYQIPIKPLSPLFRTTFEGGFDFKYLNSNLFFESNPSELPLSVSSINITEFVFSYSLWKEWEKNLLNFKAEIFASVWKDWLPHQTNEDYQKLRPKSHVRFAYLRLTLGNRYLNHGGAKFLLRLQGASGPLPSSEQFSLGGADSVRGYNESQFIADNALCLNLELFTPPYSFFKKWNDSFYGVLFLDGGYGINYETGNTILKHQTLIGIGPGIRYDCRSYASFRGDYGFQLHSVANGSRFGRFHLTGTLSY